MAGTAAVVGQAISDVVNGEVSDVDVYTGKAAKDTFVGALCGAIFAPFMIPVAGTGLLGQIPTSSQLIGAFFKTMHIGGTFSYTYYNLREFMDGRIPSIWQGLEEYKVGALFSGFMYTAVTAISQISPLIKNAYKNNVKSGAKGGTTSATEPTYSSFRDLMSPDEAARYDDYWTDVAKNKSNFGLDGADKALKTKSEIVDSYNNIVKNLRNDIKANNDAIRSSDDFNNLSKTQQKKLERKLNSLENGGNIAVADVDIPGVKSKFQAHSQINSETDIGVNIRDFSYKTENRKLTTYVDAEGYPRYHDTEAKILEEIEKSIINPNVKGKIDLYSELDCCQSCTNLIFEFRRKHPNIKLNIYVKSMK
ncbi:MAG TPA: hypothetical protein DCL31_18340 [Clostridium sp.]|nr:hypothetical protein [Clostridium sp.]